MEDKTYKNGQNQIKTKENNNFWMPDDEILSKTTQCRNTKEIEIFHRF